MSRAFLAAMGLFSFLFNSATNRAGEAPSSKEPSQQNVFADLRARYLTLTRDELFCPAPANPTEPWGVIMEIGYQAATVTTVTFTEGSSRVLRSTGGGFFSTGEVESVDSAGKAFLKQAKHVQPQTTLAHEFPGPIIGQVVFYFRTDRGIYTVSAPENELGAGHHRLSPLYFAGLRILHEFLQLQKQRQK
jgi:hypothetical protein